MHEAPFRHDGIRRRHRRRPFCDLGFGHREPRMPGDVEIFTESNRATPWSATLSAGSAEAESSQDVPIALAQSRYS